MARIEGDRTRHLWNLVYLKPMYNCAERVVDPPAALFPFFFFFLGMPAMDKSGMYDGTWMISIVFMCGYSNIIFVYLVPEYSGWYIIAGWFWWSDLRPAARTGRLINFIICCCTVP